MRVGRHQRSNRRAAGWVAGIAGLAVGVSALVMAGPAGASTTVDAQLSLSGVATAESPAGGSVVGIHAGDTVRFSAATAPTAGLNARGLGGLLSGIAGGVTGYQVTATFSSAFPGGGRTVVLGYRGAASVSVSFAKVGTYGFTWSAKSLDPLGALVPIQLDGNALRNAGIALNADNQYVGKIVVATDPPAGGVSVQLPSVGAHPSAPAAGPLPSVGVPGAAPPTVPVTAPSLGGVPSTPPTTHSPTPAAGGGGGVGVGVNYTPPGDSVQDRVVPKGYGCCGSGHGANSDLGFALDPVGDGTGLVPNPSATATGSGTGEQGTSHGQGKRPIDLASNRAPSGQMPVLLAILAIIALSLVTATYARLYLLRRNP